MKMCVVQGEMISLIPAAIKDRRSVYEWGAMSDITHWMMGPPLFPDLPIGSYEAFCDDYQEYYFDGSQLENGRGFIIRHHDESVGFISYSNFHYEAGRAELDIWLNCMANCGKGFGSEAIRLLCDYLYKELGIAEFVIRPSARNPRAVRAYEKAGFQRISDEDKKGFVERYGKGDYENGDDVILIKTMNA